MTENKKILNAQSKEYKGIKFKSKLEISCYKKLEQSGLSFKFEPEKFTLLEGFYPTHNIYSPSVIRRGVVGKTLNLNTQKIRSISYTPDFIIKLPDMSVYVDVKGMVNDTYPLKKKLFIKYLEEKNINYMFFEPHGVKQINEMIDIIKEKEKELQ